MRQSTPNLRRLLIIGTLGIGASAGAGCAEQAAERAQDGIDAVELATTFTCDADRKTLQFAIEAFEALEGRLPTSEAELVPRYIRSESMVFDVSPEGAIVAAPTSDCG